MRIVKTLMLAAGLSFSAAAAHAADTVRVSLFSWPGYGFWFIAQEKTWCRTWTWKSPSSRTPTRASR